MATNPDEKPDTIEPKSPPETKPPLPEQPDVQPDEIEPLQPDTGEPSRRPNEVPNPAVNEV